MSGRDYYGLTTTQVEKFNEDLTKKNDESKQKYEEYREQSFPPSPLTRIDLPHSLSLMRLQQQEEKTVVDDFLKSNPDYIPYALGMISQNTQMAVYSNKKIEIIKSPNWDIYGPYYLGKKILATKRSGGRKYKKSKKHKRKNKYTQKK
jgi:hypothetical protein